MEIPTGKITFCVLVRVDGRTGERISAVLGWVFLQPGSRHP